MNALSVRLCSIVAVLAGLAQPAAHAGPPPHVLIPTGSDYQADTLQRFARAAAQRDSNGSIDILVLPLPYGTDAYNTGNGELQKNLSLADSRRAQVEDACLAVKGAAQSCKVVLAPVFIRPDAYLQSNLDLFVPDLDGMYILGGDQTVAMQVVANTPFEQRMASAFAAGAVLSGNSAGAAMQSRTMINGFVGSYGPENGFQQGAVDIWDYNGPTDDSRGLSFGIANAVIEQHTFERGRTARLLNTCFTTGLLGIGPDAETAATIVDEAVLTDVTGSTATLAVDLQSYTASGHYGGPNASLALRTAVLHVVPPGAFGYDLARRRPLVDGQALPAPSLAGRQFDALHVPSGHGPLLLAGDLSTDRSGPLAQRFAALASGGRLLVLSLGYAKATDAQADAKAQAAALSTLSGKAVSWYAIDAKTDQNMVKNAVDSASGIVLIAREQALVMSALAGVPKIVNAVHTAWAGGKTLLLDNAAAAAAGAFMTSDPTPTASSIEADGMQDFLTSGVSIQAGRNWLPGLAIEPRMVIDRHWGRAYNLLKRNSAGLVLGLDVGTGVELGPNAATAWGANTVAVFDGRYGSFGVGSNQAVSARYVIFDTFVDGEPVAP